MTVNQIDQPATEDALPSGALRRILTVRNFAIFSIVHSVAFTGLMICAFVLNSPQPATFTFGFTHGVMYMIMTVACVVAARMKVFTWTTALVVIVVGLMGPYIGAIEFTRELRNPREE